MGILYLYSLYVLIKFYEILISIFLHAISMWYYKRKIFLFGIFLDMKISPLDFLAVLEKHPGMFYLSKAGIVNAN